MQLNPFKWFSKRETYNVSQHNCPLGVVRSFSGVSVTENNFLELAPVWACLRTISEDAAKFKCFPYQMADTGRRDATEHPAYRLLVQRPNRLTSRYVFWRSFIFNMAIDFGLAQIRRTEEGKPYDLWIIPSCHVDDILEDREFGSRQFKIQKFNSIGQFDGFDYLSDNQVLYCPGVSRDSSKAIKIIDAARQTLATAFASEIFLASYFNNGARPGRFFSFPIGYPQDEINKYMDSLQAYTGVEKTWKDIGLPDGVKPDTAQQLDNHANELDASRKTNAVQICEYFRVDPSMIGIEAGSRPGGNIEQLTFNHVNGCLKNYHMAIEEEANYKLFTDAEQQDGYFAEFDTSDVQSQYLAEILATYVDKRIMTEDEVRDFYFGLEPLPKEKPIEPQPENDEQQPNQ